MSQDTFCFPFNIKLKADFKHKQVVREEKKPVKKEEDTS